VNSFTKFALSLKQTTRRPAWLAAIRSWITSAMPLAVRRPQEPGTASSGVAGDVCLAKRSTARVWFCSIFALAGQVMAGISLLYCKSKTNANFLKTKALRGGRSPFGHLGYPKG
jgi:hypothetical protein